MSVSGHQASIQLVYIVLQSDTMSVSSRYKRQCFVQDNVVQISTKRSHTVLKHTFLSIFNK